jgi:hypothetical protein
MPPTSTPPVAGDPALPRELEERVAAHLLLGALRAPAEARRRRLRDANAAMVALGLDQAGWNEP